MALHQKYSAGTQNLISEVRRLKHRNIQRQLELQGYSRILDFKDAQFDPQLV